MYGYFTEQQQPEQQQQQQQGKPDIYAILSTDDPIVDNTAVYSDALVMNILDNTNNNNNQFDIHPLSKPMSHSTTPSSTISSNDFKFNQGRYLYINLLFPSFHLFFFLDFLNADIMSNNSNNQMQANYQLEVNQQMQSNTHSQNEPIFHLDYPKEDPLFPAFDPFNNNNTTNTTTSTATSSSQIDRRHSVAVGGSTADFNLRLAQSYQPPQLTLNHMSRRRSMMDLDASRQQQQQNIFTEPQQNLFLSSNQFMKQPHYQKLSTVIENETPPNMSHRASMPNIFATQESRCKLNNLTQRVNSISAKTSPMNTPPQMSVQLNPYSYPPPRSTTAIAPSPLEEPPFLGRKRFLSQQFNSSIMKEPHLCPLPMSGISSRKQSITTPQDISAWHRVINAPQSKKFKMQHNTNGALEQAIFDKDNERAITEKQEEGYPVVTKADLEAVKKDPTAIPRRQKLRFEGDEYTPKWVRYVGQSKEGYCDTCQPGKWLQLKNSAFWYHKQFFHGISSVSGKPFANPLEQRAGDHDIIEGLCHQCKEFVPICNSKRKNSVLWYRHAHKVKNDKYKGFLFPFLFINFYSVIFMINQRIIQSQIITMTKEHLQCQNLN